MDNFFSLGSYRLSRWAVVLIPILSLADFDSSDSAHLEQIRYDVSTSRNQLEILTSDTAAIIHLQESSFDKLRDIRSSSDHGNSLLAQVSNVLKQIDSKLHTVNVSHLDTVDNFDSLVVHDPRTDDIYHIGEDVYNAEVDIYKRLGVLNESINNLTNFFCYSPSYISSVSAVITNLPFMFFPIDPYMTANVRRQRITELFFSFYGRNPTTEELNRLSNIVPNNNIRKYFTDGRIYLLDDSALPASYKDAAYNKILADWALNVQNEQQRANRYSYSRAYNYLYGTRQFTDTSIGISNVLSQILDVVIGTSNIVANITNGLYDVSSGGFFEESTDPSRSGFRIGQVVKSGVSSVMEESFFTDKVSTNIVGSVDTNAILNVEDNSYKTELDLLKSSTPQDYTELQGVLSEINTASGAIESMAEFLDQDHNHSFILSLPFSMSHIGSVDLSLTLENQTAQTLPVVNLICHFLQIAIALYFFRVGWSKVVATVNFHNAEDPF